MKNRINERVERIKLHTFCIQRKLRQHQPIGFYLAGIKRELFGFLDDIGEMIMDF